jgi:hypothetical protein
VTTASVRATVIMQATVIMRVTESIWGTEIMWVTESIWATAIMGTKGTHKRSPGASTMVSSSGADPGTTARRIGT